MLLERTELLLQAGWVQHGLAGGLEKLDLEELDLEEPDLQVSQDPMAAKVDLLVLLDL